MRDVGLSKTSWLYSIVATSPAGDMLMLPTSVLCAGNLRDCFVPVGESEEENLIA